MNLPDSDIGGGGNAFPSTLWTDVLRLRERSDPERPGALERLAARYWRPVYVTLRLRWRKPREDARDLTQDFFTMLIEKEVLEKADADRGRFRTFIRAVLDNFMRNEEKARHREKRGGGVRILSLQDEDLSTVDRRLNAEADPGQAFDDEWRRVILDEAMEQMEALYKRDGVPVYAEALRRYYFGGPDATYESVAAEMGLAATDVTNILNRARARLKKIVAERVRETIADEPSRRIELRELFPDGSNL